MTGAERLSSFFSEGDLFRRDELVGLTKDLDRDLQKLLSQKVLKKLKFGLYYKPKQTRFGQLKPDENVIVQKFLKTDHFLITSPNSFNNLGVGLTQLFNVKVVYNLKRRGNFTIDGMAFDFRIRPGFPKKTSKEFLFIDLLNNLSTLGEDEEKVKKAVANQLKKVDVKLINQIADDFGKVWVKKFIRKNTIGLPS